MSRKSRAAAALALEAEKFRYDEDDEDELYDESRQRESDLWDEGGRLALGTVDEVSARAVELSSGWGSPHWFASDNKHRLVGLLERHPSLTPEALDVLVEVSEYDVRRALGRRSDLTEDQMVLMGFQDLYDLTSGWDAPMDVLSQERFPLWMLGFIFQWEMGRLRKSPRKKPHNSPLMVSLFWNNRLPVVARAQATSVDEVDWDDRMEGDSYCWFVRGKMRTALRKEAEQKFPELAGVPDLLLIQLLGTQEVDDPSWGVVPAKWQEHASLLLD